MLKYMWITRDRDNGLYMYDAKPKKSKAGGFFFGKHVIKLSVDWCPKLTFDNSPMSVCNNCDGYGPFLKMSLNR
jgi:hypothetical protein